jgi:ATP-dependent RNA helicase RhlE
MPFRALGLHPSLVQATRDLQYKQPTAVQAGAIPPALTGRDIVATAQTGTGKTVAFLLPVLHNLIAQPRSGTKVVVVSPTRELAEQIEEVSRGLCRHTPIRSTLITGGKPMIPQERSLCTGVDIVIATPGRLLDHIRRGARLDRVTTLILD